MLLNFKKPATTLLPMTSQSRLRVIYFVYKLTLNYRSFKATTGCPPGSFASRTACQHTACSARNGLRANCSDFITKDQWPPNLRNINPMDYRMWGAMLEAYCKLKTKPKTITKAKEALLVIWGKCHKNQSTRLWKTYQIKRLKACVGAWSWRWTLQTFTLTMKFWHLIIS